MPRASATAPHPFDRCYTAAMQYYRAQGWMAGSKPRRWGGVSWTPLTRMLREQGPEQNTILSEPNILKAVGLGYPPGVDNASQAFQLFDP